MLRPIPRTPGPDIVPSEVDWLAGLREGSGAAFEGIFRTYYGRLCAVIYAYVGSAAATEELVQDVFLRLWRQRASLQITDSLQAYLYRAARNTALNHVKHERIERRWEAQRAGSAQLTVPPPDLEVVRDDLAHAIDKAIEALPERCRAVFTMSRRQGLSYAEIAEALGISSRTVEVQIGRALRSLRRRLKDLL